MSEAEHGQSRAYRAVPDSMLEVGAEVPQTIYDPYERILLRSGQPLKSERHRRLLREIGRVRDDAAAEPAAGADAAAAPATVDPLERMERCLRGIRRVHTALLEEARYDFLPGLQRTLALLGDLVDRDGDAALGAAKLVRGASRHLHPLHCAVITDLVARAAGWPGRQRHAAVGAALTANLGMLELQDELEQQLTPLTETQRYHLHQHPLRGTERLQRAGLEDPVWLRAVEQHHERLDGSGYPHGASGDAISEEACLVMLSDVYTALISPRAHREAREVHRALRELYEMAGSVYPEAYTHLLINTIGIFPPGTPVRLSSGERALSVRRSPSHSARPAVYVYAGPEGLVEAPYTRDLAAEGLEVETVLRRLPQELPFELQQAWGYPARTARSEPSGASQGRAT